MDFMQEYKRWLESEYVTDADKAELRAVENDENEIESRFCGYLSFGTAGLRGTMGAGINKMNNYVVRHATQAFAEVVVAEGKEAMEAGVAICYDCRNHSAEFAREAACVMAGNGIKVRLFEGMRPTPELSFAIRRYGCTAGINVTASHNPKEYNGYKVYWSDGAQLPPEHADSVAAKMEKLDIFESIKTVDYDEAVKNGMITIMGKETDEAFLEKVMEQANDPEMVKKIGDDFKMVYTPFHGTGRELIPEALRRLGLKNVYCVEEQMVPDGNFSTVASPNPENPEGFYLAVELADKVGADFILGSDPDADRVGIMVRDHDGKFIPISGNKTGVMFLDYIIGARRRSGTMPKNPVALKTIVTTEMAKAVAEKNGVDCYSTFTGFKFLAEKKNDLESAGEGEVIFSYEESYGYMVGDFVRDKDAVTASMLLSEMAAWYYCQGKTLIDVMDEMYEKYGAYSERTINLVMPGLEGVEKMKQLMESMRAEAPKEIAGEKVVRMRDYLPGTELDIASGEITNMELNDSDVVSFVLADGTTLIVRPSGTEPKVKVYVLARGASVEACNARVEEYSAWACSLAE